MLMSPLRRIGYRKFQIIVSFFKLNFLLSESYNLIVCSLKSRNESAKLKKKLLFSNNKDEYLIYYSKNYNWVFEVQFVLKIN